MVLEGESIESRQIRSCAGESGKATTSSPRPCRSDLAFRLVARFIARFRPRSVSYGQASRGLPKQTVLGTRYGHKGRSIRCSLPGLPEIVENRGDGAELQD